MLLRIDPAAAAPLFVQLVQGVKEAVAAGQLVTGDKLPSVRELARELAINPNTVARAYERLEAEDVIVRRQGAGCFVKERRSTLAAKERKRRLADAMRRVVTDAFHTGASADEIRSALAAEIARLEFSDGKDGRA